MTAHYLNLLRALEAGQPTFEHADSRRTAAMVAANPRWDSSERADAIRREAHDLEQGGVWWTGGGRRFLLVLAGVLVATRRRASDLIAWRAEAQVRFGEAGLRLSEPHWTILAMMLGSRPQGDGFHPRALEALAGRRRVLRSSFRSSYKDDATVLLALHLDNEDDKEAFKARVLEWTRTMDHAGIRWWWERLPVALLLMGAGDSGLNNRIETLGAWGDRLRDHREIGCRPALITQAALTLTGFTPDPDCLDAVARAMAPLTRGRPRLNRETALETALGLLMLSGRSDVSGLPRGLDLQLLLAAARQTAPEVSSGSGGGGGDSGGGGEGD